MFVGVINMENKQLTGEAYLDFLSENVTEIRKNLGWSQAELCDRLGISRPTISGIENGSGKLSKTVAYALYACVFGEIAIRRLRVQKIDYEMWANPNERKSLIKQLNKILWNDENNSFKWGAILTSAAGAAGAMSAMSAAGAVSAVSAAGAMSASSAAVAGSVGLIAPMAGLFGPIGLAAAVAGAAVAFAFPKKAKDDTVTTSDQVKSLAANTIEIQEYEVLVLFGLSTKNLAEYVAKIEDTIKYLGPAESNVLFPEAHSF